jgi:hypothetical protein
MRVIPVHVTLFSLLPFLMRFAAFDFVYSETLGTQGRLADFTSPGDAKFADNTPPTASAADLALGDELLARSLLMQRLLLLLQISRQIGHIHSIDPADPGSGQLTGTHKAVNRLVLQAQDFRHFLDTQ